MPANFEAFRRNLATIPPTLACDDDDKDPFDMDEAPPVPDMPALPKLTVVTNDPMEKQGVMGMV
jgi:hypothetical protein